MTFKEVADSTLLYVLVGVSLAIIFGMIIFYTVVSYKESLKLGISKEELKKVIKSSMVFSIVPSLAIVTGLVTLVTVIGIPYGWFRLSVLGSLAYELMAANLALDALGLDLASADASAFGTMIWAVCIPITSTILLNLFLVKPVHMKTAVTVGGDEKWKALSQTCFMTALLVALVVPMICSSLVGTLTFVTSALCGLVITGIAIKTRQEWLNEFTLALSLIIAMASSVLWSNLLG